MNVTEITQLARDIRVATLKSLNHLGFGHYGGSMSVVETLAVLYGAVMKIDPADPDWPERDYFVLSKGHAGPALYSTLAIKGYFPREELNTLNQNGTRLPSHPDRLKTRGVDATTGSLGQGISIAGGMALSHKLARRPNRVFCIVGDGELNEGQCWEAFQFIAHHRLNNLTVSLTGTNSSLTASWRRLSIRSIWKGNSARLVSMSSPSKAMISPDYWRWFSLCRPPMPSQG
ncbi:putative transketolase, amino-terminus [Salmonella enterica subsp. enterica serovar Heidelberg str. 77-1831]|nr:putative transketolase, amino-terminus [Salmonella enterica subsp. enterica serovar Heidelberg str. 77-1831]